MVIVLAAELGLDTHLLHCACLDARDATDRRSEVFVRDESQYLLHIVARATGDGMPLRAIADLDQPVVVAEAHKGRQREGQHLRGGARPDAARHGQQVPVAEFRAVVVLVQEVTERNFFHRARHLGHLRGLAVEAQDIFQHPQEAHIEQIAPLRKHRVKIGAGPFQHACTLAGTPRTDRHLDRERHVAGRGVHLQFVEQAHQVRISAMVEDQETGIDTKALSIEFDIYRVGVAAEIVAGFVQRHLMAGARQLPRRGQAGNPGADDCNLHA